MGLLTVEANLKSFQYLGKNLIDDDVMFELAVEIIETIKGEGSVRFRKRMVLPGMITGKYLT